MKNSSYQRQDDQFVLKLRQYIIKNLSNYQFDVEQLSAEAGLSRSQLYRRLKHLKGLTISQFIRKVRLEEAVKLLRNDDASITDIAFMVGFNSSSYFHKCFLEHFGYTPGAVRKIGWEQGIDESFRLSPEPGRLKRKRIKKNSAFSFSLGGQRKRWIAVIFFILGLVASGLYVFQNLQQ